MTSNVKNILFRLKWLLMPEKARYAYLWDQTRANYENQISIRTY